MQKLFGNGERNEGQGTSKSSNIQTGMPKKGDILLGTTPKMSIVIVLGVTRRSLDSWRNYCIPPVGVWPVSRTCPLYQPMLI